MVALAIHKEIIWTNIITSGKDRSSFVQRSYLDGVENRTRYPEELEEDGDRADLERVDRILIRDCLLLLVAACNSSADGGSGFPFLLFSRGCCALVSLMNCEEEVILDESAIVVGDTVDCLFSVQS